MADKPYKFVDHTADVEFIAYGKTSEKVFGNAFLAMLDTISYPKKLSKLKSPTRKFTINESAEKLDLLLWYVLQDALSILDSKSLFGYKVESIKIKSTPKRHTFSAVIFAKGQKEEYAKLDVKGISRYNLSFAKKKDSFQARVVMDV